MRSIFLWALLAAAAVGVSCSESEFGDYDYDEIEQEALDMYMADKEGVYRQDEGYYIEPIDMSAKEGTPSNEYSSFWVRYNFTSRSLEGDVCHTRNEDEAIQQGTFNYSTYYAPFMLYLSTEGVTDDNEYYGYYYYYYDQDSYYDEDDDNEYNLAINSALKSKTLTIDGEIVNIYEGNKFNLYMPSAQKGSYSNGSGGYAGSTSLGTYRPMMSEIEIVEIIPDAEEREKDLISEFMSLNSDDDWDWESPSEIYDLGVYYNQYYTPERSCNYIDPYNYGELPYFSYYGIEGFDQLESAINEELIDEFGVGSTDGNAVGVDGEAKIWYITRTLDGFIIDTNIASVGIRVFGSTTGCGSSISYTPEDDYDDYIDAWYYSIPLLKYGAWATVILPSEYGYYEYGLSNSYADIEIAPFTPLLFNLYIEEELEEWE